MTFRPAQAVAVLSPAAYGAFLTLPEVAAALRTIIDLAGRYRRLAQSRQRRKLIHGTDDVTGVTLDGDVSRLLPHELAKLVIPELEDDVLRRIVERQAMCREMNGSEPVARGPVIVCCDESGSMEGAKNHASKALALAMAWVARRQKRWCSLVAYSGDSGERLLPLPPGRWDELAVLDWLAAFLGRGSSIDVPVRELPDYYARLKAPAGQTDVLFLTDAKVRLPADVRATFLAWKQSAKARLVTLVIGTEPGDLSSISDEVHVVRSLDVGEDAVVRVARVRPRRVRPPVSAPRPAARPDRGRAVRPKQAGHRPRPAPHLRLGRPRRLRRHSAQGRPARNNHPR